MRVFEVRALHDLQWCAFGVVEPGKIVFSAKQAQANMRNLATKRRQ